MTHSDKAPGIRAVSTPLGGGPLTQLALSGAAPEDWYPGVPATRDEWITRVRETARTDGEWLRAIGPALGNGAVLLSRIAAAGGAVVTTGQQPGLFGGPLYTWFKALSALELARCLERESGVPVAPVFWAATDDADFAEAATTVVAAAEPRRLTLQHAPPDGVPMCDAPLDHEVGALLAQLRAASGSVADSRALDAAAAFSPGATVGGAYVDMLRALLEPIGIAVLDAAHPAIGDASRPVLEHALAAAHDVHAALAERQHELRGAGFEPQVDAERDLSLVFRWDRAAGGLPRKMRVPLAGSFGTTALRLSPNVLLRPVVERALIPTAAYAGGPGEIAYFAQVSAVAAALRLPAPVIVPRWSGVLVPDDTAAALARLELTPDDLQDPHAAERRLAGERVPVHANEAVASLRQAIARDLTRLNGALAPRVVEGMRAQFEKRIERLERRLRAAARHRERDVFRTIAAVRAVLHPLGMTQERVLNAVPLWSRFGDAFIESVRAQAAAHAQRIVAGAVVTA